MEKLSGKSVAKGIVSGKAFVFNSKDEIVLKENIDPHRVDEEINSFREAVEKTKKQLKKIYLNLSRVMGQDSALIIETQYQLIREKNLLAEIERYITKNFSSAPWAIKKVEKKYSDIFRKIEDLSFREKSNDISDLLNRIIRNLKKKKTVLTPGMENLILVARDIPPSLAASLMSGGKLLGLILSEGGETSHTVILARSLEIPTIINARDALSHIENDDNLIIDGLSGEILINPDANTCKKYKIKKEKYQLYLERSRRVLKLPDHTLDNRKFKLSANIELPFESDLVHSYGARGIGLFRTEFMLTDPDIVTSENEQTLIYKNIAQKVYPDKVIIRTFDVGRDKQYEYFKTQKEDNPALGTMAVRLFFQEEKVFKTQLKAILRANESGNIRLLFPMITEIEEIYTLKRIVNACRMEAESEHSASIRPIEIGMMVEIPGAVKIIPYLNDEIDFFSIGTNDLIQYLLAVDRNNQNLSYLYSPFHPAVTQCLQEIFKLISITGKDVNVCGELAGKGFTALMLLGMGYTNFSMPPISIVEIKRIFTSVHYNFLSKLVSELPRFSSRTMAEEFFVEQLIAHYPDLFVQQSLF